MYSFFRRKKQLIVLGGQLYVPRGTFFLVQNGIGIKKQLTVWSSQLYISCGTLFFRNGNHAHAAHIGTENFGNADRAVFIEVIFEESD